MHVIIGAGPIGTATAEHLLATGREVTVVTRSGTGPTGARLLAADATDADRLTGIVRGAEAIYNCANPPYHRWPELWPPMARAILTAAERTEGTLVVMSNLYQYGPVHGPITEDLPLATTSVKGKIRTRTYLDALASHDAGRIRMTEARASDFLGRGAKSLFTTMIAPKVREGQPALIPADFDAAHSITYTLDVGRTLATLATDPRAYGRAWHVPSPPPVSLRQLANRYAELIGAPAPKLRKAPSSLLRLAGLFDVETREFIEVRYQFAAPWVLDSSAAQQTFGLVPSTVDEALKSML
jgi:nucleoside-diphosphate-sugar epimerase